jgi:hypothetical protein
VAEAPQIDASVPHSALIGNYWLGGKDNHPVDREAGVEAQRLDNESGAVPYRLRTPDQIAAFIVVIEDAHWADEATLDLLVFLGRRIDQTGALLVTYRDDELDLDHPLRVAVGRLAPAATRRLRLGPREPLPIPPRKGRPSVALTSLDQRPRDRQKRHGHRRHQATPAGRLALGRLRGRRHPAATHRRAAAGLPARRADRHGQLDARQLRRGAVPGHRPPYSPTAGRAAPGPVGQRGAPSGPR